MTRRLSMLWCLFVIAALSMGAVLWMFCSLTAVQAYEHGRVAGMVHQAPTVTACRVACCPGYEVDGLCTRVDSHPSPSQHPDPAGPYR